jgi:flagellin-like protein
MRKLFKCRKALSPVVAAIILIAVTVAVSIAVAAWMGALTFTFMKTEELKITNISWGASDANATLTMKDTGTGALTVDGLKINSAGGTLNAYRKSGTTTWTNWPTSPATLTFQAGDQYDINAKLTSGSFTSGTKYEFDFHTATGNTYVYTNAAP